MAFQITTYADTFVREMNHMNSMELLS